MPDLREGCVENWDKTGKMPHFSGFTRVSFNLSLAQCNTSIHIFLTCDALLKSQNSLKNTKYQFLNNVQTVPQNLNLSLFIVLGWFFNFCFSFNVLFNRV